MKHHPLFIIVFSFTLLSGAYGQRTENWIRKVEKPRYVEGTFSLNVNNVLEIISLTSSTEPYAFGKGQHLYFEYYAPEEGPYFLRMGEKRMLSYYVLESRPDNTPSGWNTFGPCPVDGLLQELRIPPQNTGVLLRVKGDDSKYFLPVTVFHSVHPEKANSYKAVFRLSRSILGGAYKVYKGEHRGVIPERYLATQGDIGRHAARSTFQVEAPTMALAAYEGWVTVDLSLLPRGSARPAPYRFFFYHTNIPK